MAGGEAEGDGDGGPHTLEVELFREQDNEDKLEDEVFLEHKEAVELLLDDRLEDDVFLLL